MVQQIVVLAYHIPEGMVFLIDGEDGSIRHFRIELFDYPAQKTTPNLQDPVYVPGYMVKL